MPNIVGTHEQRDVDIEACCMRRRREGFVLEGHHRTRVKVDLALLSKIPTMAGDSPDFSHKRWMKRVAKLSEGPTALHHLRYYFSAYGGCRRPLVCETSKGSGQRSWEAWDATTARLKDSFGVRRTARKDRYSRHLCCMLCARPSRVPVIFIS